MLTNEEVEHYAKHVLSIIKDDGIIREIPLLISYMKSQPPCTIAVDLSDNSIYFCIARKLEKEVLKPLNPTSFTPSQRTLLLDGTSFNNTIRYIDMCNYGDDSSLIRMIQNLNQRFGLAALHQTTKPVLKGPPALP